MRSAAGPTGLTEDSAPSTRQQLHALGFPGIGDAIPCLQLVLELCEQFQAEGLTVEELDYARSPRGEKAAFNVTPSKRLPMRYGN